MQLLSWRKLCLVRTKKALAVSALCLVAACASTGTSFNGHGLGVLQPGVTTLDQIKHELGAEPVAIYRETGGSFMARWAYSESLITDIAYQQRELWINFDAAGRYSRTVKAVNVPWPKEPSTEPVAVVVQPQQTSELPQQLGGPLGSLGVQEVGTPALALPVGN